MAEHRNAGVRARCVAPTCDCPAPEHDDRILAVKDELLAPNINHGDFCQPPAFYGSVGRGCLSIHSNRYPSQGGIRAMTLDQRRDIVKLLGHQTSVRGLPRTEQRRESSNLDKAPNGTAS
jgi:hypothetical protein